MSQPDEDTEKPYEATAKKLEDARKKGEVPRSTDLTTSAAYGGLLLACLTAGAWSVETAGTDLKVLLDQSDRLGQLMLADGGRSIAGGMMGGIALALTPIMLLPAVLALLAVIAQQAFTVTPTKLAPKISRISIISNFKNKFGRNGLFEFAKSFAKLIIISICLGVFLKTQMPHILTAMQLGPGPVTRLMGVEALRFLAVVLAISLSIGVIDFFWQRAEHLRKNRMSHRDMKEESKQSEGDPHMKQERRQRGYEIANNRMMADVPNADVIIVNPTHYAVALKWSRAKGEAPVCVAKGVDEIAAKIREIADESNVPIHSDPPTARALHATVKIGKEIDRDHYQAVAAAIRFADKMRKHRRGRI